MRSRVLSSLLQTRKLFYEYAKPYTNNVVTYSRLKQARTFSSQNKKYFDDDRNENSESDNLNSLSNTHKIFDDKDAEIILDISEKQETIDIEDLIAEEKKPDPYEGINLTRGVTGVFDIEELVELLRRDKARNIFVASVPSELSYVDFIVVATGKSNKHMIALATFIRKVFKLKRHKTDKLPNIEGKNSKDWIALDLGNIVLHIFEKSTRELYDLETLWSVGADYDDLSRVTTESDIMEQYTAFLSDLEPIENDNRNKEGTNK
ncbi:mitochondrial assembly of ribosomal large subunit protein 1 [Ceratina calcarata]|uniref:Mitochondrial assembly of ribosomal large subunit protein 1 n=1 Tax=Ceratina calcarata TaxID=156304 RepID=A0AAJ7J948_9HYME|nr:mitochondrial assembly of ribosomal large subunit protein 1 [Ceratina calcarata]